MKMAMKSRIKWAALGGVVLSIVSLMVHLFLAKSSSAADLVLYTVIASFSQDLNFLNTAAHKGAGYRKLWGSVKVLETLHTYADPRSSYPVANEQNNGFIYAKIFGGFEKIRNSICDLVTIARLLNATLVVLEIQESTNSKGIRWIMDDQMPHGSLSRLQTIRLYDCHGLVHVATSSSIQMLQSLEEIRIFEAESLEVVLDFTGLNVGTDMGTPLDRLESFHLGDLAKLKHIWKMVPDGFNGFKNLRSLIVKRCNTLRYLISPSMAKMFPRLEILVVEDCPQMEAIFARDEGSVISDIVNKKDGEESTNIIEFPKLKCLRVSEPHFQMFCSEKIDFELHSLTELNMTL